MSSTTSTTTSTSIATNTNTNALSTSLTDLLVEQANAYAATHSIQIQSKSTSNDKTISFQTAPISLLPNAFPSSNFEQAQTLAPYFNQMVDTMSRDTEFLTEVLAEVAEADPFTGKLLNMYQALYANDGIEGQFARTADRLGILRSDYMLDSKSISEGGEGNYGLLQVELNTIASSFAGISTQVASMHRYLTQRFGPNHPELNAFLDQNVKAIQTKSSQDPSIPPGVPENPALKNLSKALQLAHERYISHFSPTKTPLIAFIVQPNETNTIDQRLLEFQLWNTYQTRVIRISLQDIQTLTTLHPSTGALTLNNSGDELSVIYFRAGYAPTDYPVDACWSGRELLEQSRATKCPNLGYHLCGTKKMQQHLSREGIVEKFLSSPSNVKGIRDAFAGLFSLSQQDMQSQDFEAVRQVLTEQKEDQFVLKPQREGGGYNYYGKDLAQKLQDHVTIQESDESLLMGKDLAEFILMERIFPPHQNSLLLRSGALEGSGPSISEFGCFGCVLSTGDGELVHNEYAGFLLRTKFVGVDEGGVASGFATLSSPYLC